MFKVLLNSFIKDPFSFMVCIICLLLFFWFVVKILTSIINMIKSIFK